MDEISEVKKAIRHENWKRMYEDYKNSGMTVKKWCGTKGIPVKTFYYQLKVIRINLLKENSLNRTPASTGKFPTSGQALESVFAIVKSPRFDKTFCKYP